MITLSLGILFGFGSFFPRLADIQAITGRDLNNKKKRSTVNKPTTKKNHTVLPPEAVKGLMTCLTA